MDEVREEAYRGPGHSLQAPYCDNVMFWDVEATFAVVLLKKSTECHSRGASLHVCTEH